MYVIIYNVHNYFLGQKWLMPKKIQDALLDQPDASVILSKVSKLDNAALMHISC